MNVASPGFCHGRDAEGGAGFFAQAVTSAATETISGRRRIEGILAAGPGARLYTPLRSPRAAPPVKEASS